jgi:type IV pilus assembly protein PilY1
MRQGGNFYFGLDITDTTSPKPLWEFPPPGATERSALGITEEFGETWLEMGPQPAAMGPIPFTWQSGERNVRWLAFLSGGYDRTQQKGRGIYAIDPYTGELVWKAEYDAASTTIGTGKIATNKVGHRPRGVKGKHQGTWPAGCTAP